MTKHMYQWFNPAWFLMLVVLIAMATATAAYGQTKQQKAKAENGPITKAFDAWYVSGLPWPYSPVDIMEANFNGYATVMAAFKAHESEAMERADVNGAVSDFFEGEHENPAIGKRAQAFYWRKWLLKESNEQMQKEFYNADQYAHPHDWEAAR